MNYHEFWENISPYYPISKGELRLPIMKNFLKSQDFLSTDFFDEMEKILEIILQNSQEKNLQKIAENE